MEMENELAEPST